MAIFVTPPDQFIYTSSYFQKLFTFGSANDEVRICRYINHFLDLFGEDLVLAGGNVAEYSVVDDEISVTILGGKLIQDKTLVPFDEFTLTKDITGYTGVGAYVIIYTDFEYGDDDRDVEVDPCTFLFRIGIVDSTGDLVGGTWNTSTNRIVLGIYDIDNDAFLDELTIEGNIMYILGYNESYRYFDPDPIDGGELSGGGGGGPPM